ncbi:hypothetical protein ACGF4C_18460 [Streptomyces sp. NPDC048197]|uniref:hypothetical protein n=1 Tax=Streptomyces sp. NPDC048197 TaxID=3365511 RepID=UPI0037209DD2
MHIRTAATAGAITAALLLAAACGGSPGKSKAKPTTPPSDKFLGAIVDHPIHSWDDHGPTQAELLAYPPKWCAALKQGHSVDYLFGAAQGRLYPIGMDWGTEKADAYRALVMAVEAYCPTYRGRVVQELRASGDY